jgi:hypothetical protein
MSFDERRRVCLAAAMAGMLAGAALAACSGQPSPKTPVQGAHTTSGGGGDKHDCGQHEPGKCPTPSPSASVGRLGEKP